MGVKEIKMPKEYKMRVYPMGFNGEIKDKVLGELKELNQALKLSLRDRLRNDALRSTQELIGKLEQSSDFSQIEDVFNFAKTLNNVIEYSDKKFTEITDFINKMMLTEEEIAVIFAQTSRSPKNFDESALKVTREKASDFHKKWTLTVEGYGHSSIAEHAVLHVALEKISTLACDKLEESRLVSFTEQSGRYQVIAPGYYYKPAEIMADPELKKVYTEAHDFCFRTYEEILEHGVKYMMSEKSYKKDPKRRQKDGEKDDFYAIRMRKMVTDDVKQLFGPSRLTNVGMTVNARNMEYTIKKMLSSDNPEVRNVGEILKKEGLKITPTLIRFAERQKYLVKANKGQIKLSKKYSPKFDKIAKKDINMSKLISYDKDAENKFVTALLYRNSGELYENLYKNVAKMSKKKKDEIVDIALKELGDHDIPIRPLEFATDYTFEFMTPHGIYRELQRHRMMSYDNKEDTVKHGYIVPELIKEMGKEEEFKSAIEKMEEAYDVVNKKFPHLAGYCITRAHLKPMLCKFNLREAYHLVRLRTAPNAHHWIRLTFADAYNKMKKVHPYLWKYIEVENKLLDKIK